VDVLRGLADFVSDAEITSYGLDGLRALVAAPSAEAQEDLGFYQRRTYSGAAWQEIAQKAVQIL
jgi:hypothetical protein